jgi:hypothetical protein
VIKHIPFFVVLRRRLPEEVLVENGAQVPPQALPQPRRQGPAGQGQGGTEGSPAWRRRQGQVRLHPRRMFQVLQRPELLGRHLLRSTRCLSHQFKPLRL